MRTVTIFNLQDQPVQVTERGNRVSGRSTLDVDAADPVLHAALERGDVVVLSDPADEAAEAPEADIVPVADSTPEEELALTEEEVSTEDTEPKKKSSKAKES